MTDARIPTRALGRSGLTVSMQGLGCMGMSQSYGPADEKESIATIHRALDLGVFFLDTADIYGVGHNEELVGRAIRDRRDEVLEQGIPSPVHAAFVAKLARARARRKRR